MANLVILTADEFKTLNPLERQAGRRAARQQTLVRLILRTFLQRGGSIPVGDIVAGSPDGRAEAQIDIAYPFSGAPTPFRLRLSGGRERYACCATDALGIAPMVGEPVEITSSCHHCGAPLKFTATPHGVGQDAEAVMVWFGKRGDEGFDSL